MDNSIYSNLDGSIGFSIEILKHHLWNNEVPESLIIRRIIMSDEAVDIYPLTVEEYESAEVIAQDVEVE